MTICFSMGERSLELLNPLFKTWTFFIYMKFLKIVNIFFVIHDEKWLNEYFTPKQMFLMTNKNNNKTTCSGPNLYIIIVGDRFLVLDRRDP
jgi:hypothetical protein